ncbi:MAG: hypothetical protein ACYCV4_09460 [Dermatophilaceae bacterium]
MQPSGLIFLVIIAIWAAYLLQHWVGRREHLATARSVDRFSDAMRVLERRTPLPESDLSLPQPRSYSVSPARPSRAEVVVKRAQSPTPNAQARPGGATRPVRVLDAMTGMSTRRVRGLSLLASLSLAVVVLLLVAFSVLPWWSLLVVVAELVADFAWLRHAAVAQRAARRAASRMRPVATPVRSAARSAARSAVRSASRPASRPAAPAEPVVAGPAGGAAELAEFAESRAESAADVDLSGWAPVPVPPPTYTLKAKAERPEPVPVTVSEPVVTQTSSFDGVVDEGELDELLDRRRAAGA